MDLGHAHQVGAVAGIEVVHVGDVLEVVGVNGAVLHRLVGHDVVVEGLDLQGVSLFGHDVLGHLQNASVGGGGSAYHHGLVVFLAAAASQQGQSGRTGQGQSQNLLFHKNLSFFDT